MYHTLRAIIREVIPSTGAQTHGTSQIQRQQWWLTFTKMPQVEMLPFFNISPGYFHPQWSCLSFDMEDVTKWPSLTTGFLPAFLLSSAPEMHLMNSCHCFISKVEVHTSRLSRWWISASIHCGICVKKFISRSWLAQSAALLVEATATSKWAEVFVARTVSQRMFNVTVKLGTNF